MWELRGVRIVLLSSVVRVSTVGLRGLVKGVWPDMELAKKHDQGLPAHQDIFNGLSARFTKLFRLRTPGSSLVLMTSQSI